MHLKMEKMKGKHTNFIFISVIFLYISNLFNHPVNYNITLNFLNELSEAPEECKLCDLYMYATFLRMSLCFSGTVGEISGLYFKGHLLR